MAAARFRCALILVVLGAGCLRPDLEECRRQLVCPPSQVCSPDGFECVQPEQIDACADQQGGDACTYLGLSGTCQDRLCRAMGSDAPYSVSVTRAGNGIGHVTSFPAGINCFDTCSAQFPRGTRVMLRAFADGESTFAGWGGACAGEGVCELTVIAATSVTATFVMPGPPTIVEILPAVGAVPGQTVTIVGTNLAGASEVTFNGMDLSFFVESSTRIRVTIPMDATTGPILVTTPRGTAVSQPFTIIGIAVTSIALPEPAAGCVDISYALRQEQSLPADVVIEIYRPAADPFNLPPLARSYQLQGLATSPEGVAHVFRWNSEAVFPRAYVANAAVQVTATIPGTLAEAKLWRGAVTVSNDITFARAVKGATAGLRGRVLRVGDLDGDGKSDLVFGLRSSADLHVLLGNGDGTFRPALEQSAGMVGDEARLADLDRDGKLDLVVASSSGDQIAVLLGKGDGTFRPADLVDVGSTARALAIGDVNRDGIPDLATAGGARIALLLGKGDGSFAPAAGRDIGVSLAGLALGDVNADGRLDLAAVEESDGKHRVLLGDGSGGFAPPIDEITSRYEGTHSVAIAEVTKDGRADLVTASPSSFMIWDGRGDWAFPFDRRRFVGTAFTAPAIGDVDRDGMPDIVVADADRADPRIVIAGRGGPAGEVHLPSGTIPGSVAIDDLDGDGRPDLVVPDLDGNGVLILRNLTAIRCETGFDHAFSSETGANPRSIAVAHLQGLDELDVAVANGASDSVSAVLMSVDGYYHYGVQHAAGSRPSSVAIGDVDRDGRADLVVADAGEVEGGGAVSVLLGSGAGDFRGAVDRAVGSRPVAVAIADLDRDGKLDLVVADGAAREVWVAAGNGDGSFQPAVAYPTQGFPAAVAIDDLDGDAVPDLVVAAGDGVSVLVGQGDGSFAGAAFTPTPAAPAAVATGDLDRDGSPDVVIAAGAALQVLLGRGDGGFRPALEVASLPSPTSLAIGDLDGDGKLDLAAVDRFGASTVAVHAGHGDGTFAPARSYDAKGEQPEAVAIGDINRDGKPDLIVANGGSDTISVLFARTP